MPPGTGIRLSYADRVHVLGNASGSWEIRLELEQLGAGEVVGVGSIITARDTPHDGVVDRARDGVVARVIASCRIDGQRVARVMLTPLAPGARAAVTLVVRFAAGSSSMQDPIVSEVVEVEGLPC